LEKLVEARGRTDDHDDVPQSAIIRINHTKNAAVFLALALFAGSASGAALVGRRSAMVGRPSVRSARVAPPTTMAAAVAGEMSVVGCKSPAATFEALVDKGVSNSKMWVGKVMFSSITGGCFVGMGGLLSVTITGAMPGVAATNQGLIRFVFAALPPVNLLLVLQTGAQLFTGNTATLSAAFVEGKLSFYDVIRSLTLSFIGNVIGCGLIALATASSWAAPPRWPPRP
jgi:hypothetical protein